MEAYSDTTGTRYPSWEALVEAEANGWVAVVIISSPRETWPYVEGPFPTKAEAERARNRLRRKWKREQQQPFPRYPNQTYKGFVRPAWKGDR